jgi:hypothetical protein
VPRGARQRRLQRGYSRPVGGPSSPTRAWSARRQGGSWPATSFARSVARRTARSRPSAPRAARFSSGRLRRPLGTTPWYRPRPCLRRRTVPSSPGSRGAGRRTPGRRPGRASRRRLPDYRQSPRVHRGPPASHRSSRLSGRARRGRASRPRPSTRTGPVQGLPPNQRRPSRRSRRSPARPAVGPIRWPATSATRAARSCTRSSGSRWLAAAGQAPADIGCSRSFFWWRSSSLGPSC